MGGNIEIKSPSLRIVLRFLCGRPLTKIIALLSSFGILYLSNSTLISLFSGIDKTSLIGPYCLNVAKNFTDTPLWISGTGQGSAALSLHDRDDLTSFIASKEAARQAYEMSGLKPKDIQIAEVHDCFTIAEIVALEDLGFYEKGKAVEAIKNGETKRDGAMPINTSGGLKSKGHPVGATGAAFCVEVFKQMRGIAERNRQVKFDVERMMVHNLGGSGATCVVTIFEK